MPTYTVHLVEWEWSARAVTVEAADPATAIAMATADDDERDGDMVVEAVTDENGREVSDE